MSSEWEDTGGTDLLSEVYVLGLSPNTKYGRAMLIRSNEFDEYVEQVELLIGISFEIYSWRVLPALWAARKGVIHLVWGRG